MRFVMILLTAIILNSCAWLPKQTIVLSGIDGIIDVPAGAKLCNVPLPTDEVGKNYCIVTKKPSMLISLDDWNNLKKYK